MTMITTVLVFVGIIIINSNSNDDNNNTNQNHHYSGMSGIIANSGVLLEKPCNVIVLVLY